VKEQKYECLNLKCKYIIGGLNEIKTSGNDDKGNKNMNNNTIKSPTPKWLLALLLVFTFSIIGLVINVLVGNIIPFWILFVFSVIFSVEKWFSYDTRKHKLLGKLYRLILNLGMLSLLGLLIWSGIKLFSHQFVQSALAGSILFVAEFVLFIWAWRVVAKNSWRWPSMKLTVFALICLFLIFAFGGVQPMTSYKDTALSKIRTVLADNNSGVTYHVNSTTLSITTTMTKLITTKPPQTSNSLLGNIGGQINSWVNGTDYNSNAVDPSWNQLVTFLSSDNTDQQAYVYPTFVCDNFAHTLQKNAELSGWKCAVVELGMTGYSDPYHLGISSDAGHACNAFKTTDRGLVYIDVTGVPAGSPHPNRCVKTVNVEVGQQYIPVSLFPESGWNNTWDSMGTVTSINVKW
jgi:hypothetical protein